MDFVSKKFEFRANKPCVVIGEIGINHNCNKEILFRLIDEGINAGLDIIKFQRFNSSLEIAACAPTADYQKKAGEGENQLKMAKKYELPDKWLVEAYEYCKEKEVGFLCTAFEHESVDFIADKLKCKTIKISSADITNKPLLEYIAKKFDSYLLSTGASDLEECSEATNWVGDKGGQLENTVLMHCTSQYPASVEQANLNTIVTMRNRFNLPIGYSDHTEGIIAPIVSVSLGAVVVEKHYTLDKNMEGPDHKASADIKELKLMVNSIKEAYSSLGDGVKKPAQEEKGVRPLIRKTLVYASDIAAGNKLDRSMIEVKRPYIENAIKPKDMDKILGKKLIKDKFFDEAIYWSDFEA